MSTAALTKTRLERMHHVLSGYVERQEIPGLVALVSHHDDVHVETLGTMSFGHPAPMEHDSIFRIASITKPITAGWGFGMAVDIQHKEIFHPPGRFGWTGGFGTTAYTDPAEGMIGILFTRAA